MVVLSEYRHFSGRHWETGPIHNALAYQGITAPHSDEPPSEALLMGISGGAAFGYFTFEYSGYLPHLILLTRNTFDPLETLFERLSLPRDVRQTTSADKGLANLTDVLESGLPAIVWVDKFTLPYNCLPYDENNWHMTPLLVYGIKEGQAYLADRAEVPIQLDIDTLQQARARVKKDKFRVMALGTPNWDRLPAAVSKGIWQCISLFTDAPPKGKRDNFGLAGLNYWAKMLTNTRNKQSWVRYFPPGERLWMALVGDAVQPGAYSWIRKGKGNSAERGMYADFLNEAAIILGKPTLEEVARLFRQSEAQWTELSNMTLRDDVPELAQAADLLTRKQQLFLSQGTNATQEIQAINTKLNELMQAATDAFPVTEADIMAWQEELAAQVLVIHDAEHEAITQLQSVMTE